GVARQRSRHGRRRRARERSRLGHAGRAALLSRGRDRPSCGRPGSGTDDAHRRIGTVWRARPTGGNERAGRAGRASMRRLVRALDIALTLLALLPALALAHPLGNFTINHFAALRLAGGQINLDVVVDRAEIPAFQERQRLDAEGDGNVSPGEQEQARQAACPALGQNLALTVGSTQLTLQT